MEGKFVEGLANATHAQLESVRNLREEFIQCGADEYDVTRLETIMGSLYYIYIDLSRKLQERK